MERAEEQASGSVKYKKGQPLTFTQALALRSYLGQVLTHSLLGRTLPITLNATVPGIGRLQLTIGEAVQE